MSDLMGRFNDDWFLDQAPGTVQFYTSKWHRRPDGNWDVDLEFMVSGAQTYILGKPLYGFGSFGKIGLERFKEVGSSWR